MYYKDYIIKLFVLFLFAIFSFSGFSLADSDFSNDIYINFQYKFFYDDNVFYTLDENKVSSKISSFILEMECSRTKSNLFYRFGLKCDLDRYEDFSSDGLSEIPEYEKNKVNLSANLEVGYKFTDRVMVKLKDDFERKYRPDFLNPMEVVYGKFNDNKTIFGVYYRIFTRTELKGEVGIEKLDYDNNTDSQEFSFINSTGKLLNFGVRYHFSGTFYVDLDYSKDNRDFDVNYLDYTDELYFIHLHKILDTYMAFDADFGVQDRSYDTFLWDSGKNVFSKLNFSIKRERSIISLNYTRTRSLAANYSEDFYMMNLFDVKFKYNLDRRNILFLNVGFRRDNFELYPADFENPEKGLRVDKYYNFNISYLRNLSNKYAIEFRYNRFKRDSNNEYFPFTKNVFAVSFKINIFNRGSKNPLTIQ